METAEAALIERAKADDREAFAQLYAGVERPLAAFLYRLTAARQDAEDLAQETAVKALETVGQFQGASSFRAWMFRLAVHAAFEYLRGKRQWDPDAQIRAGKRTGEHGTLRGKLRKLHKSGLRTTYTIREHIGFCFICMGRSLPPHEQAALLLVEVQGFSVAEAAEILEVSSQVLQFRVQQARQAMVDQFEPRCGLINKQGSCTQCGDLHTLFHGDRRRTEQALFQIELEPQATAAQRAGTFTRRLAIVGSIDPLHAEGTRLHEWLMNWIREAGGY